MRDTGFAIYDFRSIKNPKSQICDRISRIPYLVSRKNP